MTRNRNARRALARAKSPKSTKPAPVSAEIAQEPPQAGEIVTMRDGTKYRRTEHGNLVRLPK